MKVNISKEEMLLLIESCLYNPIVFGDLENEDTPAMIEAEDILVYKEKAQNILATIDMVFNPEWEE
jgi:hypothetical protein